MALKLYEFLFGEKKKTLNDLSREELDRERIMLEQKLKEYETEEEKDLEIERKLKTEYTFATLESQKNILARKIMRRKIQGKNRQAAMGVIDKSLQAVYNLLFLKDREDLFTNTGVLSQLNQMSVGEITMLVNKTTNNGRLQNDKIQALSEAVSEGMETDEDGNSDLADFRKELDFELNDLHNDAVGEKIDKNIDEMIMKNDFSKENNIEEQPGQF